ncbi:hypothetical protein OWV82_019388 [Melia azedarach]|uniref:Uncharacterized protein n=1 Tax=Melia azedarach TaxID=155640 RepID=A0ACC1XEG7_MELAZ|nr:hypothetical protein OWV82_019388 [Melia azedarach]
MASSSSLHLLFTLFGNTNNNSSVGTSFFPGSKLLSVFLFQTSSVDCKLVSLETQNINGNTFRILQERMNQYQDTKANTFWVLQKTVNHYVGLENKKMLMFDCQ